MCVQVRVCDHSVHAGSILVIMSLDQYVQEIELVITLHLLGELNVQVDLLIYSSIMF